jgi:hypothetical protein
MGHDGPARTRTWDQGIMRNRIPLLSRPKAEDVEAPFRRSSRPTHSAELIPNARPKPGGASRGRVDPDHRGAGPNRPNRDRVCRGGVGEGVSNDADNARRGVQGAPAVQPCKTGILISAGALDKQILKDRNGPQSRHSPCSWASPKYT